MMRCWQETEEKPLKEVCEWSEVIGNVVKEDIVSVANISGAELANGVVEWPKCGCGVVSPLLGKMTRIMRSVGWAQKWPCGWVEGK